uniref:non-specific serine/threonine protein kinase n=1 Tax=Strongyloides stercoralis TaxID=6248 RepID=A0A0K0DSY2_STRER|nr:SGK-related kinase [Strongyloides stercoralis]
MVSSLNNNNDPTCSVIFECFIESMDKNCICKIKYMGEEIFTKQFRDFQHIYNLLKPGITTAVSSPPKKNFFSNLSKVQEKRKIWIENFLTVLVNNYSSLDYIQTFFDGFLGDENKNHIYLGPSERKTAKPDDFDIIKTIGKGSFGMVFLVQHKKNHKIYAMKVLKKEQIKKRNEVKRVMAERNVLKANINHPFLVSLHYSFQTKHKLYFILDYLNGGELFFHLQKERSFSETRSRFYAANIASALGYLHKNNIIYRDLKPENLLLDKYGYVVITDFGLCKEGLNKNDRTDTFCGTPEYLAPEVILKQSYNYTVDWWCLGVVLYEMIFTLPPFYSRNVEEMYNNVVNEPLYIPATGSAISKNILTNLLQKNPSQRLGAKKDFEEIKNHPFFMPIDWDKLLEREIKAPYIPKLKDEYDVSNIDTEFTSISPNISSLIPQGCLAQSCKDLDFINFTFTEESLNNVK